MLKPLLLLSLSVSAAFAADRQPTICNPLNLPYRFETVDEKFLPHRSAADPSAIFFQGEYWLFASKSGGYWHSKDFINWTLVEPNSIPVDTWAPDIEARGGKLYYSTQGSGLYATATPADGDSWTLVSQGLNVGHDQHILADDDGRVYMYTGCSNNAPIRGVELDASNYFKPIGRPVPLINSDLLHRGWEARRNAKETSDPAADAGNPKAAPWVEGAWVNKAGGRYYLQYAAPGTQHETYADGVFVSDSPLGPFAYQPYSPFSAKPGGYLRGAGHGGTFQDARGNYWHVATAVLSKRHSFERRLAVYPAKFFADGQLACNTYLGDYPQYPPGAARDPFADNSPGWMLLSYKKTATASSSLPKHEPSLAVNESIRDWWSAATGDAGEWLAVDLGKSCRVEALQVNFADEGATQRGRLRGDAYRYYVEYSADGQDWKTLLDRKDNTQDAPHDYAQLPAPVMARHIRITNVHTPAGGKFSLSGLRVFGNAPSDAPSAVKNVTAQRNSKDWRGARVTWSPSAGAEFYIIRYGIKPDRLFLNIQLDDETEFDLNLLNDSVDYWLAIDAVNASGITRGAAVPVK